MALLPEELHNYNLSGLSAMADLMTEILEGRAPHHESVEDLLISLDELREDIDQEIEHVMADIEQRELSWLPQAAPEVEVCQSPR